MSSVTDINNTKYATDLFSELMWPLEWSIASVTFWMCLFISTDFEGMLSVRFPTMAAVRSLNNRAKAGH